MTFLYGMLFYTFSTTVFKTYYTTVFKTIVKHALDRQTLYFTVAFVPIRNTIHFFKQLERKLAILADTGGS